MKKTMVRILHRIVHWLARQTIRTYKPYIIAITGSVGKTSAKEAIYAALCEARRVRKTQANFNNELGVPLTILGNWHTITRPVGWFWIRVIVGSFFKILFPLRKQYPEVLVLEYGADRPGDIAHLLSIAHPNTGVISAIGEMPVHVEFYPSGVSSIVKEKSRLVHALNIRDSAVLNADDPHTKLISEKIRAHIITYGCTDSADVSISHIRHIVEHNRIIGITFKLKYAGSEVPFTVQNAFSIAHAYAVACAVAVASEYMKLNLIAIFDSIEKQYRPMEGRSVILKGIKNTQVIDESYNSSPLALETALKTMQLVAHTRRVAVLGDMLELGSFSIEAHEKAGILAAQCIDVLITVGSRAKLIAQKAIEKGMYEAAVHSFDTAQEAGLKLQEIMKAGDIILVKGSHSLELDKVVEEVRA
ncbi:MAG: UDP-N-acetylmuramoyl-tripeptide--D-alanyl-D-alanine ligase [Candidatus Paceibacterota bacterium]